MARGNGAHAHADPVMAGADLMRVATAGSVDDGKSTLIGRLLYDSKLILEDQLEHLRKTSARRGDELLNLALLTDGLRAEREQGITIDVAYRYFSTPRRKFILADTPGHVQYTRNMVTGASTADLALILIDAQKGVVQQSRRHAVIASLLRVPHFLVCINKMDLVDFDEAVYDRIRNEFTAFAAKLDVTDVAFIPVSALHGDNVVTRSERMPWYAGGSLLNHLETLFIASDRNLVDCRFPVQMVVQPTSAKSEGYRGYAGQVAGGVFKPGDDVVVLPSDLTTTISAIDDFDGPLDEAFSPLAVTIRLADDIDLSRGDMICRENNRPRVGQRIDAMVCWMTDQPLNVGGRYVLKHTTRTVNAHVADVQYRLDIDTLHREEKVDSLGLNDIGRLALRLTAPIFYDEYRRNRTTGAFILIDAASNVTVGAGMILGPTAS
ncbi:MAG: GTP-binding protein [Candidatus Limnocylindrales bacterium]